MSQTFKINKWDIFFRMVSNMIKTLVPQVKEHFESDESMMFDEIIENFSYEDLAAWLILDTEENKPVSDLALDQIILSMNVNKNLAKTMKEGILNSYNGLYRVNNINDEFVFLENLLLKEPAKHIPVKDAPLLKEGMIILARIVDTNQYPLIFKILHKIEPEQSDMFMEGFLTIFEMMDEFRRNTPALLKQRGLDIFLLYSNTFKEMNYTETQFVREYENRLRDLFDEEVVTADPLGDEADRLETFIFIQEEYLEDKDLSFHQMDQIDLIKLMKSITGDGAFESDQELTDFASFLEEWALTQGFEDKLDEIKQIQAHIFEYKQLLQQSTRGIYLDEYILNCIHEEDDLTEPKQFIQKFNQFLELFHQYPHFNLTEADRFSRSAIDIFIEELGLTPPEDIRDYSEIHFPILHLWHVMGRMKNLLHKEGKKLQGTSHYDHYQKLSVEGQLSLWIQSIFNLEFLEKAYSKSPKAFSSGDGQAMMKTYGLIFQELFKHEEILPQHLVKQGVKKKDLFILELFVYLGILKNVEEGSYTLTPLGEKIGTYYNFLTGRQDGIIYIDPRE